LRNERPVSGREQVNTHLPKIGQHVKACRDIHLNVGNLGVMTSSVAAPPVLVKGSEAEVIALIGS